MKANNTTKRVKTLEEINAQAERLMQANETWYQDATRANREPINRKAQIIAAWHNTKTAAKELQNNTTPSTSDTMNTETKAMNEQTKQYFRNVYGSYQNLCKQADERLATLRNELQEYHDNHSKGGAYRRKNMQWLQDDIKKLEQMKEECKQAFEEDTTNTPANMNEATKSVNDIMNQANRLMSECNTKRNFKRTEAIRKIAFRYFDNIRACAGSFNSNDDAEYNKQYSRAQYMKEARKKVLTTSDYWHTDNYTVVNEFPAGAIVWNIGRHNFPFPGFVPVAWPLENYTIDRSRLMAVKCKDDETADAILKEAGIRGVNAERFAELNA